MNEQKTTPVFRKITEEELSEHNSVESAWVSLNGIVYDVTVYMSYHPGGLILLEGCGMECADLFSTYHHTQTSITPG
jgi:cytochrome-b5 reductase